MAKSNRQNSPEKWNELASAARPLSEVDYGSERQITAENLFFETVSAALNPAAMAALEEIIHKATTDEAIDAAVKAMSDRRNLRSN